MIPIGDPSNELFKMYGMYAEIFENLQVIMKNQLRKLDIMLCKKIFKINNLFPQQIMNFTYDLTQPPDGQWGAIQPDGSWSGLVGMLMRGEIDIGNRSS